MVPAIPATSVPTLSAVMSYRLPRKWQQRGLDQIWQASCSRNFGCLMLSELSLPDVAVLVVVVIVVILLLVTMIVNWLRDWS